MSPTVMSPVLVVCAHGTDDPAGQATVAQIAALAAERLPGVEVRTAFVDVQEPRLDDLCDQLVARGDEVVVVPLLLSTGYHLEVDVAAAAARHPGRVVHTGPLGPHPKLAAALVERVLETGVVDGPLVIGVAGSSRPSAAESAARLVDEVSDLWPGPVSVGFLAAAEPRLSEAVALARHGGEPVTCASYLIGPGYFQGRLRAAGADLTTEPLGAHPLLVDLVVRRYRRGSLALPSAERSIA